jgi:SAV_6107-like HEPN
MHMHMDRSKCRAVPSATALLRSARDELAATDCEASAGGKYVAAHLAASRAAAAVVTARGAGVTTRGRVSRTVWELLPQVEPALSDWAAFFAAGVGKRAAAEAGLPRAVSLREANDLLRNAETFVSIAECALAIPAQRPSPPSSAADSA